MAKQNLWLAISPMGHFSDIMIVHVDVLIATNFNVNINVQALVNENVAMQLWWLFKDLLYVYSKYTIISFLQRTPFSSAARTLLNIMTMTTGEFDYSGIFRLAPTGTHDTFEEIPFPPVSYILWIVFIILMPILLTNLLVSTF